MSKRLRLLRPDDGSKDLFVPSGAGESAGLKPLQENQKISTTYAASWTEDDRPSI